MLHTEPAMQSNVTVASPVAPSTSTVLADFRAELAGLGSDVDRIRQDAGFRRALDAADRFWRY